MLPAPERSTTDLPPPLIFPFIESRSVRVPVNGRSLVTRPELASASMSSPASAGTIRSMLPADVSRFTSPGTGDFNFALILHQAGSGEAARGGCRLLRVGGGSSDGFGTFGDGGRLH